MVQLPFQPEVDGERCVQSVLPEASCRCCVDVCPRKAWQLDDEALALDTDACDGCGLCAAVCPSGAIPLPISPLRRRLPSGEEAAFLACEVAVGTGAGSVPCLHAVGLGDILALYRRGVRHWRMASGDCGSCPRGRTDLLAGRLADIARLLASRGQPAPEVGFLVPTQWRALLETCQPPWPVGQSRRNFLRRVLVQSVEAVAPVADAQDATRSPGMMLDAVPGALWPWVPVMDAQGCIACDSCARLCPEGALRLEEAPFLAYVTEARRCTGCGLCRDICPVEAVALHPLAPSSDAPVGLLARRCRGCGAPFHAVAGRDDAGGDGDLCRVCRQTGRHRALFQRL